MICPRATARPSVTVALLFAASTFAAPCSAQKKGITSRTIESNGVVAVAHADGSC